MSQKYHTIIDHMSIYRLVSCWKLHLTLSFSNLFVYTHLSLNFFPVSHPVIGVRSWVSPPCSYLFMCLTGVLLTFISHTWYILPLLYHLFFSPVHLPASTKGLRERWQGQQQGQRWEQWQGWWLGSQQGHQGWRRWQLGCSCCFSSSVMAKVAAVRLHDGNSNGVTK